MPEPTDPAVPPDGEDRRPAEEAVEASSADAAEAPEQEGPSGAPQHWLDDIRRRAPQLLAPDGGLADGWWSFSADAREPDAAAASIPPAERPAPVREPAMRRSEARPPPQPVVPARVSHRAATVAPQATARSGEVRPSPAPAPTRTPTSPPTAQPEAAVTIASRADLAPVGKVDRSVTAPAVVTPVPERRAPDRAHAVTPVRVPPRRRSTERSWASLPRPREVAPVAPREPVVHAQPTFPPSPQRVVTREIAVSPSRAAALPRVRPSDALTPPPAARRPVPVGAVVTAMLPWPSLLEPDDDAGDQWPAIERRRVRAERLAREQRGR